MTWTIFRNELRMVLRDTRTVLIAVVTPLVLFPLLIFATNYVEDRETERLETTTYELAVTGERATWARAIVEAALAVGAEGSRGGGDADLQSIHFELVDTDRPDSLLQAGDLHLVVEGRPATPEDSLDAPVPVLEMRFRGSSDFSRSARARLEDRLVRVRAQMRDSVFAAAGFPVDLDQVALFESENVASSAKEAGSFLGGVLVPFLVLLMLSGGSIVASDSISGEKERGTLETLLTTAASRKDIVHAKMGAVMAVGLAVALINVANIGVYIGLGVLDLPDNLQIDVGVGMLLALLLLFLPVIVMAAASLLLLSGVAKSYKEYQIYFLPLFLVFLVPSLAAFLPGVELNSAIAFVPVSGIAVATRALLMGDWSMAWGTLAFVSTGLAAALLLRRTENSLSNERLITSVGADEAEFRGGPALFPRHALRWFMGFWVAFFVANLWFAGDMGIRGQVVVNLVVIFFGGSLYVMRRYGLDAVETLQLHRPHWRAWPAALVGAPSFLVLAEGLGKLVDRYLFPVPDSMIEAFSESLTGLPLWQMVLFIAVAPGILEEIAFRGVLFSGLRKSLAKPWAAVLVSGLVFGFFHVSLFRILPTALLGVVLAFVVLRTGSIFPAMLWHFLNNFLALVPQELGWLPLDPAEGVPPSWYAVAFIGAGVSWLLLKERPGQRPPDLTGGGARGRSSSGAAPPSTGLGQEAT